MVFIRLGRREQHVVFIRLAGPGEEGATCGVH